MKTHGNVILALGLCIGMGAWTQAEDPKAKTPELQVLERYIGTWEETTVAKPALWTPQETTTKALGTRRWILNGSMLENKGSWKPGDREFIQLTTYDPNQKEYRQWYFDQDMPTPMTSQGTWDEATKTFTFTGTFADGIRTTSEQRFTDKDSFTWTLIAKDGSGKVVLDMVGKCVRKK